MAQRAAGVAKRPVRAKTNRTVALAAQEAELDESKFASLTADLCLRRGNPQAFTLAPSAEPSKVELHKSRFLSSTAGLLVNKGEAGPSVLKLEAKAWSDSVAMRDQDNGELRGPRDDLAALRSALSDRETAPAQAALDHEQAREGRQHENQATERAWKTAEAARLAEAEAQWREQAAMSLAEVRAQAEAARDQADGNIRSLQDRLAALELTLADRETALAKAALDHEQAREGWQHESQAAEHAWKTAEAAHLAEAEAQWREQAAMSLAEVRAQAKAARNEADGEIRSLRDELAALRSAVADRETALAKAASHHEQARETWRQGSQAALSKADHAWKTAEAARLAEAEAKSARALAEARAQAEAARNQADGNIRSLQDQLAALRATLADHETALAKAALDTEQVRERGQQELEAALAKAKAWEAGEAARLAAAEAEWWKQSADALNEATARYQAAEGMLAQVRMQADRARSDAVGGSIRSGERAAFGARPAERETESAPMRLPNREERGSATQGSKIVIRPKQMTIVEEPHAPRKRGALRDIVVVASLAILVIVTYPTVEPLLPDSWRSNITAITGGVVPPPNVTVQRLAAVVSDVNLRAGPSTTAKVITTLPRGLKVATIERRGDWTLVQIEGNSRNTQPRRGWVYGSFLKDETAEVGDEVETVPSKESE